MRTKLLFILFMFQAFIFNLSNVVIPTYLNSLYLEKYMFGYFIALWSMGMLLSSPFWGELGDRYGRKKFVVLGVVIYGLSQLGFYFIDNVILLMVLRVFSGIGVGAPVTLLLSYLISNSEKGKRTRNLSMRIAFITIGSTISYKVGGFLGLSFTEELFLLQAICSVLFIFLVLLFVKNEKKPHCAYPKQHDFFQSLKHVSEFDNHFIMYLISITLTTMTFTNLDKFIDVYVVDVTNNTDILGNIKMVFGVAMILTSFFIIPKIKKYLGKIYVLQFIQVSMAVIVLTVFMYSNIVFMLFSVFLGFIVLKSIFTISEQFYLSKQLKEDELGLFIGVRQSFVCLGMIVGPIIGGYLYQSNPMILFLFSVVCLLASSLILSYIDMSYKLDMER